jgi:hypothetical protein
VEAWLIMVLFIGALIGLLVVLKNKDIAYGLVFIWAYLGIMLKHISPDGFNSKYPAVIAVAGGCIVLFIITVIHVFNHIRSVSKLKKP